MNSPSFPSYVAFTDEGSVLVCEPAKRRYVSYPEDVVRVIKNEMGSYYKKEYKGNLYSPQEISAFLFGKIKKDAESFLNKTSIKNAVITVPAYFDDNQRTATKDAALIAGLNVLELINEPTAACIAYGIPYLNEFQRCLVFDLGGGTLDVTVLEFNNGIFQVKATSGDTNLGRTDMTNILTDFLAKEFEKCHGVKLNLTKKHKNRLIETAERVIIDLTTVYETDVNLPFMGVDSHGNPLDLEINITRNQFDELIRPILRHCENPIKHALDDSGFSKNDIDKLIFVGEATKIPFVRHYVQDFLGIIAEEGIDPVLCVAQGAAIKGATINGEIFDDFGIEPIDEYTAKEIFINQIKELEEIVYFSKKYVYESSFEEKINDLNLEEITELISILKEEIIK